MINNNLDFEKNSNETTLPTTKTTTSDTTITHSSHSNLQNLTNNANNRNSFTNKTITIPKKTSSTATAKTETETGTERGTGTGTTKSNNTNDNSYFNRFDNRIAANLAAVLSGTRLRSSSVGRTTHKNYNAKPTADAAIPKPIMPYSALVTLTRTKQQKQQQQQQQHFSNSLSNPRPASPAHYLNGFGTAGRCRPLHLFTQANLNCNDNEKVAPPSSSDEDNSPTELNNCKRLADKPPLVKRLTMGLLRHNEDSRPLVMHGSPIMASNPEPLAAFKLYASNNHANYSNGYVNDDSFEPAKYIDSKFGDSCRQSLTAIPMLDNLNLNDNNEFNMKKRYLRETSSANSSPKIFAHRVRLSNAGSRYNAGSASNTTAGDEEAELKDASWYQAGISRDIATEVLASKSPGAFLVRKSTSKPGCYALTLRVPSPPGPKIANYIILRTTRGYKIKGFRKEFTTLKALITHHSVMPELLPVPLAMPRPTNMSSSRRNLDDFDTYDSLQMLLKYLRAKNMEQE